MVDLMRRKSGLDHPMKDPAGGESGGILTMQSRVPEKERERILSTIH